MKYKRIFLAGASGFIGSEIYKELENRGYETICFCRNREKARKVLGDKARIITGDILDKSSYENLEFDAVIYAIGIIREKEQRFEDVHHIGVKNLIEVCKRKNVERFILISANGVEYADTKYFRTKLYGEEELRKSGLIYTIFRPSVVFGENDKSINQLINLVLKSFIVPVIPSGCWQVIYVKDLAKIIVDSINNERTYYKTYEICGAKCYTIEEIVDMIIKISGKKRLKIKIPKILFYMICYLSEKLGGFFDRDMYKMTLRDNKCRGMDFLKDFDIKLKDFESYLMERITQR